MIIKDIYNKKKRRKWATRASFVSSLTLCNHPKLYDRLTLDLPSPIV